MLCYDQLKQNIFRSKPGKFWKHFQSLSRRSKPTCRAQISATADAFNDHFLSIPYKTIADVASTVPASDYTDKFFDRITPSLEFSPVDVDSISLIMSSLHVHKASGADGISPNSVY